MTKKHGGIQGYCQSVRDEAPTQEYHEILVKAFGGLAILFSGEDLAAREIIALMQK